MMMINVDYYDNELWRWWIGGSGGGVCLCVYSINSSRLLRP